MTYQVVETVQSILEARYDSIEDFESNVIFAPMDRSNFITDTYNKLVGLNLVTQADADKYLEIANNLTTTYGDWDNDNQSYVVTRTFQSEDDYNFLDNIYEQAYPYFRNNLRAGLYTITRHPD